MVELLSPEDLANPRIYAHPDRVYDLYAHLREHDPVIRVEPQGYRPFWVLTRHDDIVAVERNPDVFKAGDRTILLPEKIEAIYKARYGDTNGVKSLTHMDGDYHRAHRNVTSAWFGPKSLRKFEAMVEEIASEFVDLMAQKGPVCDFSADIAYWYPLRVIMTLMGVPKEDEPAVLRMTQRLLSPADKDMKTQKGEATISGAGTNKDVFADFADYFSSLAADRSKNPRDDLLSVIVNARVNGEPMADREKLSYFVIAATAGHDTTSASIGGGLLGLLEHPEQMRLLRDNRIGLLNSAAEEFVRWTAPVKHFMRTPASDVTIRGKAIPHGEALMLCYASACRDEAVFADADQFRVERTQSPSHLAFGIGPHFCLGRALALMEIRAFYDALLARIDFIELQGEPAYIESSFVSGLKSLPIRYRFK